MNTKVLLTGGAGFIGSHTALELTESGFETIIADNYSNSSPDGIKRLEQILHRPIKAYEADVCSREALRNIFRQEGIGAVVHFAGYKAVGESVEKPLMYYQNNLDSAMAVLDVMKEFGVKIFVFSSSATVYGTFGEVPFTEETPTGCTNPYGWTKWMIERILLDAAKAEQGFTPVILRYFNPVGAHISGLIGENPKGVPNNLMPYIQQVAAGKLKQLNVFGDDYDTPDGTGIRDYIHVVDLAKGHVKALEYAVNNPGPQVFNLGTGKGSSVLEVVTAFEKANGVTVPYRITGRRDGDVAACYADAAKAKRLLGWIAEKSLTDMCRDAWRWQRNCMEQQK